MGLTADHAVHDILRNIATSQHRNIAARITTGDVPIESLGRDQAITGAEGARS